MTALLMTWARGGALALLMISSTAVPVSAQDQQKTFGFTSDINFASAMWSTLTVLRMVGPAAIMSKPYIGEEPHGAILTLLETTIAVNGQSATVLVKTNYLGESASVAAVSQDPAAFLDSITVMAQREDGYDPGNRNWFYAKYNPDGTLQRDPQGVTLAGRIGLNSPRGCIPCHRGAPGNDFVHTHDRFAGR